MKRCWHKFFHWFTSDLVYSLNHEQRQCSKCGKREKQVGTFVPDGSYSYTSYSWIIDCEHGWQDYPKKILNNQRIETIVEKKCNLCGDNWYNEKEI